MVWVRVPATTANMGAGFDCMGAALSLYNTILVDEISEGISIINKNTGEYIPSGENNLIYRAANIIFDAVGYKPTGIKIIQNSQIPMTRGLGSSSACIIGGMLAANAISGRQLSYAEILDFAAKMEGHPDNVTPALYGGFCAAVKTGSGHTFQKSVKICSDISFVAMIPDFFVSTRKSRGTVPDAVSYSDAVFNAGRSALFALSLATGDLKNLREAVRDRLHQPYRSAYIEHMEETFEQAYKNGAYAVWLSGSGPTIMALCDRDNLEFSRNMDEYFRNNEHCWKSKRLTIDNVGAVVRG